MSDVMILAIPFFVVVPITVFVTTPVTLLFAEEQVTEAVLAPDTAIVEPAAPVGTGWPIYE